MTSKQSSTLTILIAFLAFAGLGLSGGLLGVGWPYIQKEFNLALDSVNALLIAQTITYTLASFFIGRIMARLGSGRSLFIGMLIAAVCLFGMSTSASWVWFVIFGFFAGLGSGMIDAGLNLYVTAHGSARDMNWLHACFGVGITVGPLVMTYCVLNLKWQVGYAIAGGVLLAIFVVLLIARKLWLNVGFQNAESTRVNRAPMSQSLRVPAVWFSALTFLAYVGLEIGVGQWAYTLLTQSRGVSDAVAGPWVSVYWGVFTGGRIFFGLIANRFNPTQLLRTCLIAVFAGAVLFAWNPLPIVGSIGLIVLGFAEAPVFAMLMTTTPNRVGIEHAENGVSLQMTCVGIASAVLPGFIGTIGRFYGFGSMTTTFVVMAIAAVVFHELSHRFHASRLAPVA